MKVEIPVKAAIEIDSIYPIKGMVLISLDDPVGISRRARWYSSHLVLVVSLKLRILLILLWLSPWIRVMGVPAIV
jgi:hypothetical protein